MKKRLLILCFALILLVSLTGCGAKAEAPKIGVSLGVGSASRWAVEKVYMEECAAELGAEIEVRLNHSATGEPQSKDCMELIDSGIDVLIIRPKDLTNMDEVVRYAREKNVKVVNYAGLLEGEKIDLFVGYDCEYIGEKLGQYLTEQVYQGDYIVLSGDATDKFVSPFIYKGAMKYIEPLKGGINVLLDANVPGWDPDEAKRLVMDAVSKNGNKVDAILAPNDAIAGACAEAVAELGVANPVVITGMDAQLDAIKRIVAGTQSCTIFMDSKLLASTAVTQAYNLATGQKVEMNAEFDNSSGTAIPSNLINKDNAKVPANVITGQLITKENIDRILIDSGNYTKEEIYE